MGESFIKIGYVKVVSPGGKTVRAVRYEDAFFSPLLCESLRRETAAVNRLCCCCRADGSATVELSYEDRGFIVTGMGKHTPECAAYLARLSEVLGSEAVRGLLPGGTVPVLFGWSLDSKKLALSAMADDLRPDKNLGLGQFLLMLNVLTMNGCRKGFLVDCWRDSERQSRMLLGTLTQLTLLRRDGETHRVTDSDCYSEYTTPVGSSGFFYGKIEGFSTGQVPEKDLPDNKYYKRLWLHATDFSGRKATITVDRENFRDCLWRLPFRESVWFFGKVTHMLEKRKDPTAGTVPGPFRGSGSVRPKKKDAEPTEHVSVCRQFVLLNCNDCGMAVFSRDEYDRSNRALLSGAMLYRPLVPTVPAEFPRLMEYREWLPDMELRKDKEGKIS